MKIKINEMPYEIIECSNSDNPLCDGHYRGKVFYFDRKIFLNKDNNPLQKRQTLRHELTHAFLRETQIINQEDDFSFSEEMMCEFVAKYGGKIEEIIKKYFNE